jgi:signal transduction histidine kinase/response regulator RpfG family c-di-GMP phosphodiesterase
MADAKVNILIVDDKPEKVLALEAVLEELGQNIVRAYSGREALRALLREEEFAVILLDVNMPGMDGFETAQLIRQRQSTRDVPIIFVTAFSDEMHMQRGYSLGAVDYILAPVVPDVLRSKVGVFVELARKNRQLQRQSEVMLRRTAQLQQLAGASMSINSALSVEKMLQVVTDAAREIIGAHQAITLFILDPGSHQRAPRTQAVSSFSDKYSSWRNKPLELDPIARTIVAQSRAATRLSAEELRQHPDWDVVRNVKLPPVVGGILAAPFTGRDGRNLGVIYLSDRLEGHFTHGDETILVQLAQMASIAIVNAFFAEERETNRIKDEFLSTLSHELRTPLNAILGWTQLLRMEPLAEEVGRGVDVIERNARAQAKLIEDLLDVSRITTGKLGLIVKPLRLSKVIESALDAVKPLADAKQVKLIWTGINGTVDSLAGDADRLQQVVWNLLSNAIKFTPSGGFVEINVDRVDHQLRMRVADSGQGISPQFLPYVFERFRQADATSRRSHGGLGIGLAIVRHIVELHGGTVRAESPGESQGATLTVLIPCSPQVEQTESEDRASEQNGAGRDTRAGFPDLSHMRVLVVDDEPDARDVVRRSLEHCGASVRTADSVESALREMDCEQPDVLISDIAMPDRDGYELLRAVRALKGGSEIPALALTAHATEEDRARALAAGFLAHLAKPIYPSDLIDAVARAGMASQSPAGAHLPE